MPLKWLSNTSALLDRDPYILTRFDQTETEARASLRLWLQDKVIGRPQATELYTVEQLEEMGMVGAYEEEAKSPQP